MCERAQSEEPTHLSVLLSFKNGLHNFLHTEIYFFVHRFCFEIKCYKMCFRETMGVSKLFDPGGDRPLWASICKDYQQTRNKIKVKNMYFISTSSSCSLMIMRP